MKRSTLALLALLTANPAFAQETVSFASAWNTAVQLTAEREADVATADVASPAWVSADWVLEPAPNQPGAFYIRNSWREKYLTYLEGVPLPIPGSSQLAFSTNVQLLPKYNSSAGGNEALMALGQTWVFEKVPGMPFVERIRTAHHGFGMSYLTISSRFEGTDKKRFREPFVSSENKDDYGAMWVRFPSSHGTQEQCVKNMSGTVFDVDWYFGKDVILRAENGNLVMIPKAEAKPQLTERKSLFFESCETSDQRMVAAVRLYGKDGVSFMVSFPVTIMATAAGSLFASIPGGVAGYMAGVELDKYLEDKPNTVYIGAPGKISIKGTLYDASAEEDEPLLR